MGQNKVTAVDEETSLNLYVSFDVCFDFRLTGCKMSLGILVIVRSSQPGCCSAGQAGVKEEKVNACAPRAFQ